ncbi:MBL fold metallo-hydrolase [Aureimonas sp. AU12]|uniref:MBL fold metallo-hydrolase n=1 Tax=Aureimonas sp. AU12 TaxID=1638161 RepID=UPI0007822394|nr:MBL fold metallo-hydrolase [Aureimonas sp. AU12]
MKNPYYDGPATDHFDGLRFSNYGQAPDKSFRSILRWRLAGNRSLWPASRAALPTDRPPGRSQAPRLAFVGHASMLLQMAGLNLLFDPVWSERVSPFRRVGPRRIDAPGIRFEDLPPIDAVLLTHNHYDHMDLGTLARLHERDGPRIVTPLGNDTLLRRAIPGVAVETGDWGDTVILGAGVEASFTPANHWSARALRDRRMALWSGFFVSGAGTTIYHSGDTSYGDGRIFRALRERHGTPDIAILPMGAYEPRWFMGDQHVSPADAVRILEDIGAARAFGFHWGTFNLSDEGLDQPVADLAEALRAAGLASDHFHPMRPGEHFDLST